MRPSELFAQQVGSPFAGAGERLLRTPLLNRRSVTRSKDFGHLEPPKLGRTCIHRWRQQVVLKRISRNPA